MIIQAMRTDKLEWHSHGLRMKEAADSGQPILFGDFVASPGARMLMRRGLPVEIGSRAFDLLLVLLRARGRLVPKDELVRQVWPSTTVEEANLRVQMALLRKALGEARHRIKTITGRGYMFAREADAEPDAVRETVLVAPVPDDSTEQRRKARPAIVIIDEDPESRAALHRLLGPFDADVQSFRSLPGVPPEQPGRGARLSAGKAPETGLQNGAPGWGGEKRYPATRLRNWIPTQIAVMTANKPSSFCARSPLLGMGEGARRSSRITRSR